MDEKSVFGDQGLPIAFMIVLSIYAAQKFKLTQVGAVLFSFVIAFGLYYLFNINTIQSSVLANGVPGVL